MRLCTFRANCRGLCNCQLFSFQRTCDLDPVKAIKTKNPATSAGHIPKVSPSGTARSSSAFYPVSVAASSLPFTLRFVCRLANDRRVYPEVCSPFWRTAEGWDSTPGEIRISADYNTTRTNSLHGRQAVKKYTGASPFRQAPVTNYFPSHLWKSDCLWKTHLTPLIAERTLTQGSGPMPTQGY